MPLHTSCVCQMYLRNVASKNTSYTGYRLWCTSPRHGHMDAWKYLHARDTMKFPAPNAYNKVMLNSCLSKHECCLHFKKC